MEDIPYDQLKHAFEVLQELDEFREAKQHCDFVIRVGPKEIHVHRNVLCANSEYFKAMLLHDTVENQSGMVELKDMDADCAALCADFMYGKKISISREKWETLMYSADRLQLHKLRAFLEKFLVSSLAADTFYDIRRIANLYNCAELEKSCEEFAPENFESISQLEEFHQVDQEYVISMLTSKLNTTSETIKMKALLSWIKAEVENRSKVLLSMLKTINLSSIPLHNLRYWLEKDDLISQSFECSKLLTTSVMDAVGIPAVEPDATGDNFNCIALFDGRSRHLQCFNPQKNTLTQMHELLHNMNEDNFTAITLHNNIFVLMKDKRVFRLTYTSTKATWERKADTLHEHGLWPPVVADSRYIYVVGCWGEEVSIPSIEKYDTITNRWTWLSNHKEIQSLPALCCTEKYFVLVGEKVISSSMLWKFLIWIRINGVLQHHCLKADALQVRQFL